MFALLTSALMLLSAVSAEVAYVKWSNVPVGSYGLLAMPKPNGPFSFPATFSNGLRPHM